MGVPINNVTRRVVFAASGTGPYAFTFEILAATDIAVYRDDTLLTLTTDYTVTIASNGTGSVTLTATPTGATQIAIVGNRTIQRTSDFVTGGDFFANTLNDELDQQTIFAQQNAEGLARSLQAPQTDPTTINMIMPRASVRANKTLSFDANGNPTAGVSAADVANAVTYATNAANSATAAAASASAASSSASSASSSASTATTQASNASTSASNASTSATNASNSASSASTSASNASTSATNAANSASSASTSATNAANSASSASTSASNASTSATNAANSATAAATSETNAAASAAAAATALDNFDDRYLGAKSSNPTVDNDGNALVTGALYYRTTTPVGMKVWDGSQWLEASAAQQSLMVTYEFVATAGQTTFSGADANGATLSYVANSISVSLNGVTLRPGDDYTATNGTSIVLTSAAALNDELMVIAFAVFNVANTYTQSQVDGFTVKLTGDQTVAGTKTFSSNPALSAGTANGVLYLNGSKVATSGSALTFNGSTLGVTGSVDVTRNGGTVVTLTQTSATGYGLTIIPGADTNYQALTINNAANTLNNIAMYGDGTAKFAKTLGVGNATPSASGAGITFPATQSASTDANTLDDYEEGTWTPSIGGTATYSEQNGRYTKIGRVVIVEYTLGITTRGTGSTTDISGLPFAISSNIQASGLLSYYANLAVNVIGISAYGFNASTFRFYGRDTAGVSANGPLGIFGNGAYIQGNLIYYTT